MNKLTENPKEYYHIILDNDGKIRFKSNDMQHRFGMFLTNNQDNFISLRPQSCGKPSKYVSYLSTWIRTINNSFGNFNTYSYTDTIIKFNSIENANTFLDAIYDVINKPSNKDFYSITSFSLCGSDTNSALPKGVIQIKNWNSGFKFFKISEDFQTITKYDFKALYNKIKLNDDLFVYNFKNKKVEPNPKNPAWV